MIETKIIVTHGLFYCQKSLFSGFITDIEERYKTSYTAPCNGVDSHGAEFGVFGKCKTNEFMIFAHRAAFYVCFVFTPIPQYTQVTHALEEPQLF